MCHFCSFSSILYEAWSALHHVHEHFWKLCGSHRLCLLDHAKCLVLLRLRTLILTCTFWTRSTWCDDFNLDLISPFFSSGCNMMQSPHQHSLQKRWDPGQWLFCASFGLNIFFEKYPEEKTKHFTWGNFHVHERSSDTGSELQTEPNKHVKRV